MIMRSALSCRFKADVAHRARNPHMRGTTSVLRLLFGLPLGVDHAGEFLELAGGHRCHLFDGFALVNYLLCSAVRRHTGARGASTARMRRNCARHFRAALEILEPTVVVVQGKAAWRWVAPTLDDVRAVSPTLHAARVGGNETLVATFTHPSAPFPHNWGANERTPYLLGDVASTVARVRAMVLGGAH